MYQTSEQFNSAILGDYRKFQSKLRIGTSEVTEGIRSIKQTIRSANGDNISVGGAISSYIEVEMWYPQLLLGNAEIEWILTLELPSGGIEEIPMGLFTVQDPKEDDGVVRFAAYDRIYSKRGMPYFSELNYPADGKDILREISSQTGVPIDVSTLPDGVLVDRIKISSGQSLDENGNAVTNETFSNPFDGYIHREALGNIAMIYGRIAVMDRAGNVVFKWYSNTDYSVGIDRHYGDLVLNESVFSVGTISCQTGSSVLTSGSGTENVYLENNIMTQSKLDAIYQQFQALEYIPATFSFLGDSRLDICDIITVHDIKGNIIKVPLMEIVQEYDGGLLTRVKSFGGVNQESSAVKGPTVQKMDRMYTELFLAKELIGNKASFEDLRSVNAEFQVVKANMITVDNLEANVIKAGFITAESIETQYARIDLANIKAGSITNAMLGTAVVGTTQIADGSITDAKIVDLTANKINAGTLSVERLEIRGSNKSIVYALNNITGALQAQNVDTLNGEILTQRSITADKIVANSITGNEIAAKTINANNINVTDLFAQDITATGIIRGMEFVGATGDFTGTVTATNLIAITAGKISIFDFNNSGMSADFTGDNMLDYSFSKEYFCARVYNRSNAERAYFYMDTEDDVPAIKGRAIVYANAEISLRVPSTGIVTVNNESENIRKIFLNPNGDIYTRGENITINHSMILRNDDSYFYILINNDGEENTVSWNSLRPFIITKSNGHVSIGNGLSVKGGLTTDSVLNMGSSASTGSERQIRFQVSSGTYPHFSYFYGGNSNSTSAIGVWDNKNSRGVWNYDDVNNQMVVTPSLYAKNFVLSSNGSQLGAGFIELVGSTPFIDFRYGNSTADYTSRIIESSSGILKVIAAVVVEKAGTNNPLTVQSNVAEASVKYSSTAASYFWAVGPGAGYNIFDRFGFYNGSGGSVGYIDKTGNLSITGNLSAKEGTFYGTYTSSAGSRFNYQGLEIRENGLVGSAQSDIGYAPGIGFHWSGRIAASLLFHSDGGFRFMNQAYSDFSPVFVGALYLGGAPYGKIYCNTSYGLFINPMGSGAVYLGYDNRCLVPPTGDAAIRGNGDATYDCGHTSYLWKTVYSKNGVKTTSDEREKDIMSLDLSVLSDYFMSIKPIAFRWKYGNDKKIHLGVGAQTTERKMIEAGYDPSQFDMIQHDDLEIVSDSGLMERYGINYQDLNMLTMMQTQKTTRDLWKLQEWALSTDIELAVVNQKQETQEARIRDLELQLADALFEIEQLKARIA